MSAQQHIGLYFGSFNPIHIGHLIVAESVLINSDLDRVRFVVSPQNPHKEREDLLHEQDRLNMVRAAIYDNIQFEVTDIEFRLPKPSFTIDTLSYLQEKEPDKRFSLIMGGDNLKNFRKWKNWEQILEFFSLIVYPRPGSTEHHPLLEHEKVSLVEAPLIDISATYIRKCIKEGKSVQYLIPGSIDTMVRNKRYYQ